jgi:cohesin loading factor subunit SCC2
VRYLVILRSLAYNRLANGSSIHTMSALLLQLLQASAYGAVAKVRALRSSVLEAEIMGVEGEEKLDFAREVSFPFILG